MNETLKDRFGNEITVGALVTFPTRIGSSLYVRDGVVTRITEHDGWGWKDGTRQTVRIPRVHIRVEGEKKDTYTDMLDRLTVVKAA